MRTKQATLIHADGTEESIDMPTNGPAALRKLYEVIGCTTVEHIELRHTVWSTSKSTSMTRSFRECALRSVVTGTQVFRLDGMRD